MKLKLTVIVAAALMVGACKGGEEAPTEEQVAPAEAEGEKGKAEGAAAEEEAAEAGELAFPCKGAEPENTKVYIQEFSDFQCPFCGRVNPTIDKVMKEYDSVRLCFGHNALPFHKDAKLAAIASMAAHQQGKFWEMHDKLFENQRNLKRDDLVKYAEELELDVEKFKEALDDEKMAEFVENNRAVANATGATGTPGFFINGKVLKGAQPFPKFQEVIEAEVEAMGDEAGKDAYTARTKENNKDLAAYIFEGKEPPKVADAKKKKKEQKPRPVDRTVYKVTVDEDADPILGNKDALVTLAVFSEFQCPFCKRVKPTLDKITEEYGDKVRFVFKHNPLPFHKQAMPASLAAACAQDQGKFWEMHDKLFENQRALGEDDLKKYAKELGLDVAKWQKCFDSEKYADKIEADQELAGKVTARGTPNTFVNGRKLTGAKPFDEFKQVIDEEIEKAEKLIEQNDDVTAENVYEHVVKDGKVFEPLADKVNEFEIDEQSAIKGETDAKVRIVEFSDFECPFCARVGKPLEQVKEHYGDKAAIVFKHFPLSFHKQAMPASLASECAREQGKFWEFHDLAFANQKELGEENFFAWAKELDLKEDQFKKCFESKKYKDKIEANMAEGRKAGVRGTPTIYINGQKFTSPSGYNLNAFAKVIDKHILEK
ncbi:MAG: DsbA family protein [Myxococcota bacterium]